MVSTYFREVDTVKNVVWEVKADYSQHTRVRGDFGLWGSGLEKSESGHLKLKTLIWSVLQLNSIAATLISESFHQDGRP